MDSPAKFEERNQRLYLCSLAHSVKLCLQDCTKSSRPVRDALARSCTTLFNYHLNVLPGLINLKMNWLPKILH